MEKTNNFFENLFSNIRNNPSLAGYLIALVGAGLLIAVLMDADWMLEGGNGLFNIASISKMFGRNVARILMGILSLGIIFSGLGIALLY